MHDDSVSRIIFLPFLEWIVFLCLLSSYIVPLGSRFQPETMHGVDHGCCGVECKSLREPFVVWPMWGTTWICIQTYPAITTQALVPENHCFQDPIIFFSWFFPGFEFMCFQTTSYMLTNLYVWEIFDISHHLQLSVGLGIEFLFQNGVLPECPHSSLSCTVPVCTCATLVPAPLDVFYTPPPRWDGGDLFFVFDDWGLYYA